MGRDYSDAGMTMYWDGGGNLRDEETGELVAPATYEGACECGFLTTDPDAFDAHVAALPACGGEYYNTPVQDDGSPVCDCEPGGHMSTCWTLKFPTPVGSTLPQ